MTQTFRIRLTHEVYQIHICFEIWNIIFFFNLGNQLVEMNYQRVLFEIVSPVNAGLILILNMTEIIFIWKMQLVKRRKSTMFMLNLAISDLFLGFTIVVAKILNAVKKSEQNNSTFFKLLCSFIQRSVIQMTLMASVLTINILTTERFLAVKYPHIYNRITRAQRRNACFGVWMISILITLCFYFSDPHDLKYRYHEQFIVLSAIIVLSLPWPIVSYTAIRRVFKRRFSRPRDLNAATASQPSRRHTFTEGKRFLTLCLRSFIIFVICWLPYAAFGFFVFIRNDLPLETNWLTPFQFTAHMVAFINSTLNPILYLYTYNFGQTIQRHFKFRRESRRKSTITIRAAGDVMSNKLTSTNSLSTTSTSST